MDDLDIAILISSYDGANDLWDPLEQSYVKFWKDIPFKVYLITNNENYLSKLFNVIKVGNEKSWSDSIIKALKKIKEKHILLTFDDLFLFKEIETKKVIESASYFIKNNYNYMQLYPSISSFELTSDGYREKKITAKYRNGTVWSLWKVDVLLDLLDENENAWEFERKGNLRSRKFNSFYCTNENLIPYLNGVIKGKWDQGVIKKLKLLNITVNTQLRQSLNGREFLIYKFKKIKSRLYRFFM